MKLEWTISHRPEYREYHESDVVFGLVLVHCWLTLVLNFKVFYKEYDEGSVINCVYICLEHNAILNEIKNVFIRFFHFFFVIMLF